MTEKPDTVIRPAAFNKGSKPRATAQPLTPEEIRAAGATLLNDVRMDKATGGVVKGAWGGKDSYFVLFPNAELPLNAEDLRTPLGKIKEVKARLEKLGEDRVWVIRQRADGRLVHREERVFTKEMLGESIAETFAKEQVFPELAEKTLGKRLTEMTKGEKLWTSANAAMTGLFLYSAVQNFSHSVEKNPLDPDAKREIHWSQLTWGAVNTLLAGLSAMQVVSAVRGHPIR